MSKNENDFNIEDENDIKSIVSKLKSYLNKFMILWLLHRANYPKYAVKEKMKQKFNEKNK